ncbi:TIMELESS domain-containing protein/TIMELESS_C domain-containing protein [Cephalotus follicularis]|uniref:TIMELESS domain-containing protein/TIMELESS_C domain-containing protein n=1 Tax=Cephalotus follicularis TaxID=3775 RepID=A0A1Q3CXX5_CEPFO|nr:TIMELESS domain-containing protein/TIMELESS_C domain-containing protein [Cephalotus follicularis]
MDMEGLSVICAGLGIAEEDLNGDRIGYSKEESCLDNLKDLLRFLRRDDPQTREVFKQVCKWNIVSKDLIPIIEHCQDDRTLVLNAVKVLVFLTMPIEPSSFDIPQQMEYLWALKSSITCSDAVAVVVSLLESPLENLDCELFTEDDWKLVQLVLTLFRNILAIQDIALNQKTGGSASHFLSTRDRFLELLFHENVTDLIIIITQHVCGYFRQDNLLLLEIFHNIFVGQDPELVANAHLKESKVGGDTNTYLDSLKSIMEEEEEKRKLSRLHNISRHSQFSGTFARLTMDGSKAVVMGNPASASHKSMLKPQKGQTNLTKKLAMDHGRFPSTKENILVSLQNFVNQFLSGSYNVLIQSIREDIEKEHHAIQNSDIIIFFQVAQFITSFQYHKFLTSEPTKEMDRFEGLAEKCADNTFFEGNICGPIAASMNESMFLLVISRWRNAFDGLKETKGYKFLSAAGFLMKAMIRILDLVLKILPEDSKEPQTARILLYKLFYDQTDQGMTQFLLNLVKTFDTHKQAKSDLADLVEMIHVIVRLMENLQARGTLRVSRKSRKGKSKKVVSDKKQTENKLPEDHVTSQNEIGISNGERTAELCLPQNESLAHADGKEEISTPQVDELEMSVLKTVNPMGNLPKLDSERSDDTNDDFCCGTDDSSGDEQPEATNEVDFKVSTFISAFANWSIIKNLCWLLKFYKSNSTSTNHYIIRILWRITDDLEFSPMLYQLSLLKTFNSILVEQKSCPCKDYKNIVNFLTSLVRKMLKKMKNDPLLFIEALFWKTRKECHYINAENLLVKLSKLKKESGNWGNDSGNEEFGSSHAKGWARRNIADALGEDEADVVISHEQGYRENGGHFGVQEGVTSNSEIYGEENSADVGNALELELTSKRKRRLVLNNELENKIKTLYEKFKNDQNCCHLIAESLDPEGEVSAAQVYNKLKQLELRVAPKKRMRRAGGPFSVDPTQPWEGSSMERESALHNSINLEGSLRRQPLNQRKRVCAFNEDQEAMIKSLFEQFKDHRRCSYMIANALDPDKTFTAVQVSHKLKQLGLRAPRRNRSEDNLHVRDSELNEFPVDEGHISGNEKLISFKKRSKGKDRGKLPNPVLPEQSMEGKFSDDSDNETLNSVLKKTRKLLPKPNHERIELICIEGAISDEKPGNRFEDFTESERCNQSLRKDVSGIDEEDALSHGLKGTFEAEVTGSPFNSMDNLSHQTADYKLEDSADDVAPVESMINSVNRRKLRMVLDLEDDD